MRARYNVEQRARAQVFLLLIRTRDPETSPCPEFNLQQELSSSSSLYPQNPRDRSPTKRMPKVRRSSTLAYLPVRRPLIARLPRRMSAEDAEEQYRREKFGIPGPIDTFLAAQMARGVCCSPGKVSNTDADTSAFSQDEDEVHCTVSVQRIKVSLTPVIAVLQCTRSQVLVSGPVVP